MTAEKYPTKYKLLKDLPTLKAGAIFEKQPDNQWGNFEDSMINQRYYFTEKDLHHNPDWFEKIYENRWTPRIGETFYYITKDFRLGKKRRASKKKGEDWARGMFDEKQIERGNCFRTIEGAKCCRDNFIKPAFKKYHKLQRSGAAEC